MGKILIIVAMVLTGATAFFGFVNRGHLQETSEKLVSTKDSLAKSTMQLASKEKELKSTKETLQTAVAEKEQLNSQVASLKGDLDKSKTELTALNTKITEKTAAIDAKEAETTALKASVEELKGKLPGNETKIKELETQIAENKTLIDTATEQRDAARKLVAELKKKEDARKDVQRNNSFSGRILAVNQAWNFVVLNLGDRNGMANNVELLVKRGTQLVGKVRVTSVEPATSIADIVASNIPGGVTLQPNDQVISINEAVKE